MGRIISRLNIYESLPVGSIPVMKFATAFESFGHQLDIYFASGGKSMAFEYDVHLVDRFDLEREGFTEFPAMPRKNEESLSCTVLKATIDAKNKSASCIEIVARKDLDSYRLYRRIRY